MAKPDLQKHTLNLRSGDWDYITARFSTQGKDTSSVIRAVVSSFVDTMKKHDEKHDLQMDLDL